jgi:hypothetical protein
MNSIYYFILDRNDARRRHMHTICSGVTFVLLRYVTKLLLVVILRDLRDAQLAIINMCNHNI